MSLLIPLLFYVCSLQQPIEVTPDGQGFRTAYTHMPFIPYGANYAPQNLLLDDEWEKRWAEIEGDFDEMRKLRMNTVRVHLQVARFMADADHVRPEAIRDLRRLVSIAERQRLYLDITGLACYNKANVPAWYDAINEADRWAVQRRFWRAIAATCARSNAVFFYDLINEPLSPGDKRKSGDWYAGEFGGFYWLQFITLDPAGRPREQVARDWVRMLVSAIRQEDRRHLVSVGMLPVLPNGVHLSGFMPKLIAPELDFLCVHIYPPKDNVAEAMMQLDAVANEGKPVIIEETFPLNCTTETLRQFLLQSRGKAAGWIGHYFGDPPEKIRELQRAGKANIGQLIMLSWLDLFEKIRPDMTSVRATSVFRSLAGALARFGSPRGSGAGASGR